jgi:iron complex outermembrane receptor protein
MTNNRTRFLVGSAMLAAFIASPALAQDTAPEETNSAESAGIGEIIVTARKRAESAQKVPLAINAFSPELIREKNIVALNDLAQNTSGVTIQAGPNSTEFLVVIRGQNALDSTLNLDQAIGIYLDGVYIGPQLGNGLALNFDDVSSVEVLKGPQGTLYGRNTSGGALKVDHNEPTYDVEGWGKVGLGSHGQRKASAVLNVPLATDTAALRLYGGYSARDGFGRNLFNGNRNFNDETYSFAGTLRLDPAPNLKVILRGTYDHHTNDGIDNFAVAIIPTTNLATLTIAADAGLPLIADPTAPLGYTLSPETIQQAVDLFNARSPQNRFDTTTRFPNGDRTKIWSATSDVTWDISPDLQLRSITSYRHLKSHRAIEFSGQSLPFIVADEPLTYRQFSEELNLNGKAFENKLDYTLGLFYLHNKGRGNDIAATSPTLGRDLGADSPVPTGRNVQDGETKTDSFAAYAQATYEITDGLRFTGGLRYTHEKKGLRTHNRFVFGTYNPDTGFVDVGPEVLFNPVTFTGNTICFEANQGVGDACFADQPFTFEKVTWLASVDYQIAPSVMVYAKTSRGFRSGGGQQRLGAGLANAIGIPPFGPESVDDYELGIKADFLDRRVRANLAVYRADYTGMQRTTLAIINNTINSYVSNAGKAKIQGVEFELQAKPFPELTLGFNGAYTDPKYKEYLTPFGDYSQHRFQGIADFVYTLSAAYKQPTTFGSVGLSASYWHTSSVPLQPDAGPATFGGPTNPNPWATQKAYGLLNGRAEVNFGEALSLAVWGKNLTNKNYFTYNLDVTAPTSFGYASSWGGEPRTWGAEVTYRF